MVIVLFLYYLVQFLDYVMSVNGAIQSESQQYRTFYNSPHNFYRQQQRQEMTNGNDQKWYYTSDKQPSDYAWQWTNGKIPSSNSYQNSFSSDNINPLSPWSCGISPVTNRFARIMGGQDTVPHAYPWMVSLSKRSLNNVHLCGGTLITRRHVLTAAHCLEDFDGPQDMRVILGSYYLTDKRTFVSVSAMTAHPQYNPETFANDVAIITLQTPIPQNDPRIDVICLPPDDTPGRSYPPQESVAVAIGWGSTYFGGEPSVTLKQVVLPILPTMKWPCNIYITYAQGQFCAGEPQGGADTCQADSGGPLMIENPDGRWEIAGITSYGRSCGKPNTPGVYTRVAAYNSFIRSKIDLSRHSSYYLSTSSIHSYSSSILIIFLIVLLIHMKNKF